MISDHAESLGLSIAVREADPVLLANPWGREVYGTTGARITVRFFGGWNYEQADLDSPEMPRHGYAGGVPMGGALDKRGNLPERVCDVALSDGRTTRRSRKAKQVGSTVDLSTASYSNSIGAAELRTLWRDPAFDPAQRAFYYVRVLEISTPSWQAYDAVRFGDEFPSSVKTEIQDRAYTSPIWYAP